MKIRRTEKATFTVNSVISLLPLLPLLASHSVIAEEEKAQAETIQVTGSRIKQNHLEGAQPVTVISAEQIEREGFTTAFEALSSLTQFSGAIQDEQFSGGFTQAANGLDLRSVGPNRTLVLLDGKRAANYPLPFNGQSNIVNLANIPSVMVERIEILSSGASAIYGSDAVAGVVNIILKDNIEGTHASLRGSDTTDGGGETHRAQLSSGLNLGKFKMSWGAEYFKREPIWRYEREFQDSYLDDPTLGSPDDVVNSRTFLVLDPNAYLYGKTPYIDPGEAACAPLSHLANNSIEYSFRPGRSGGNYCGSNETVGIATLRNAKQNTNLFSKWSYELGPESELFGTFIYTDAQTKFNTGNPFWQFSDGPNGDGYFLNRTSEDILKIRGRTELWQRIFTVEEMGANNNDNNFDEQLADFNIGFRSVFSNLDYELNYNRSTYDTKRQRRLIVAEAADRFFLGESIGAKEIESEDYPELNGTKYPEFNASLERLYTPLTPDEFGQISAIDTTTADSVSEQFSFVLSGTLTTIATGDIQFASVLEYGSQSYDVSIDPGLVGGKFFGFTGTGGGGERDRYAMGVELSIPLSETLKSGLAARWDKYDDVTDVDDAITYGFNMEWRPTDTLLFRSALATSFRAPDMHYVFADRSGFFTTTDDDYRCRDSTHTPDGEECEFDRVSVQGFRQGSLTLQEEEADSLTVGMVWDISGDATFKLDYYAINMSNIVEDYSVSRILRIEADCKLKQTAGGKAIDPTSAECLDALKRVVRNPVSGNKSDSEKIQYVKTGPINTAIVETRGIDLDFGYRYSSEFGDWGIKMAYNHVLSYKEQTFSDDPIEHIRDDLQNFDSRSRFRGSLNWSLNDWSTTLVGVRTGSTPNWEETERCCNQILYNASLQYSFNDALRVGLYGQNIFNSRPPVDPTYDRYPYYSTFNFNPYGRELALQINYSFE